MSLEISQCSGLGKIGRGGGFIKGGGGDLGEYGAFCGFISGGVGGGKQCLSILKKCVVLLSGSHQVNIR